MSGSQPMTGDYVVVFRGTDPYQLDLVQDMLASESMAPRRLGRTSPALMGGGNSAFEQMIEVPAEHAEEARALIDASPADEDDLARQALATSGVTAEDQAPRTPRTLYALLLLFLCALFVGLQVFLGQP